MRTQLFWLGVLFGVALLGGFIALFEIVVMGQS
jgi:hypothetical protein